MHPKDPGIAPVLINQQHIHALTLAAVYFEALGATDIRVRLAGFKPPEIIKGVIDDHRPDMVIRQGNLKKTPMIVESVLDPRELNHSRATLFQSAAQTFGGDLAFIVSSSIPGAEFNLRYRLAAMNITPQQVIII